MAMSSAEKTGTRRALIFYKAYMNKSQGARDIPSDADLSGAFADGDLGTGTNFAVKVRELEEVMTSFIAPQFPSNVTSKIEEET